MNWFYLFTSAEGRISRQPFLIATLVLGAAEIVGQWLAHRIEGERLGTIVELAFTYPEFMLSVKRANDRDMPTYMIVAFYAGAVLIQFFVLLGLNGPASGWKPAFVLFLMMWGVFAMVLIIELYFRRGTAGPNRFGPDPLAPRPTLH